MSLYSKTKTKMKKRLLARMKILLLPLLVSCSLFAQNKTISGKVTDSKDGSPLPGVSVVPAGSTRGTTTNAKGEFQLSVPLTAKSLIFSSVGFTIREVPLGDAGMTVSLVASNSSLNEIVVIGYGSVLIRNLIVYAATVTANAIHTAACPPTAHLSPVIILSDLITLPSPSP